MFDSPFDIIFCLTMTFLSYAGNTMIILVMTSSQSQPRAKTTRILFSFLAINDMCFMTTFLFGMIQEHVLMNMQGIAFVNSLLRLTFRDFSNWILVVISTERFLCIFRPLTVKNCCHKRCVITALVLMFIAVFGQSLFRHLYDTDEELCLRLELIVCFAAPCIIITVETIAIAVKLRKIAKQQIRRNAPRQQNNSATGLLIAANLCFIITMLPYRVVIHFGWIDINDDMFWTLIKNCVQLMTLNYVLNFYLYFAFNANFRQDTLKLVGCKK